MPTATPASLTTHTFPEFAFISAHEASLDEPLFHLIHESLSEVSDRVSFLTPEMALADLRGMQSYFETSEELSQTFLKACHKRLAPSQVRFFTGNHLMRSMIFLLNDSTPGFHPLGALHLHYRQVLRNLNWEQWLRGVLGFVALYEQSQSAFLTRTQELREFVKCLQNMRFQSPQDPLTSARAQQLPSPSAARSVLTRDELERRFGRFVATVWEAFCHPHEWRHFADLPLRQLQEPLKLERFSRESAPAQGIPLNGAVPEILSLLSEVLEKLRAFSPLEAFGIKEFTLDFVFESRHSLRKSVFLNEPFFELDRTSRTIIEQSCAALLRPHSRSTKSTSDTTEEWEFVWTPEGLALSHRDHPERLYFVHAIERLKVTPLRISPRPKDLQGDQLFCAELNPLALADVTELRKELWVHHGQLSEHYLSCASLTRPYESRPTPTSCPIAPESNLFSHTFLLRPPAVLRRSLPFCPQQHLPAPVRHEFARRLVYLESVGRYDFFVWIDAPSDSALWLGSPVGQQETPVLERHFECLGYFDSLTLLPDWVRQQLAEEA